MKKTDFMVTVIIIRVSEEKKYDRFAFILPHIRWSAEILKIYQDTSANN